MTQNKVNGTDYYETKYKHHKRVLTKHKSNKSKKKIQNLQLHTTDDNT